MFIRDLERLARSMNAQKLDHEYIRHYLKETYQVDDKIVDQVFERIGLTSQFGKNTGKTGPGGGSPTRP